MSRPFATALVSALLCLPAPAAGQEARGGAEFARLVARLSEAGGYFPSDNLVSNESSYLTVLPGLRAGQVRGGAYLGVGPEQNFSYIAAIEPEVAFLIDIRRDNLLLHLLLKTMFEAARNRLEYLCFLYGRPAPPDLYLWTDLDLPALLDYLDRTPMDSARHDAAHRRFLAQVERLGVPLDERDRATLRRFHDEFAQAGLDIRYGTRFRAPRLFFPTNRQLYLATDFEGAYASYLATEDRWRVVRELHRRDRIIPVVGDLAGPKAVRAIARYLRESKLTVSAFYLSNVESYLFRGGTFPAFAANVRALPARPQSVLIRSWFSRGGAGWNGPPSTARPFPACRVRSGCSRSPGFSRSPPSPTPSPIGR